MMKWPAVLQGHTLAERERIEPLTMSITLKMDDVDTVTMTMREGGTQVGPNDWVRVTTPQGEDIICRRKAASDMNGLQDTVTLEHVSAALKKKIIFGEVTAADMGGTGDNVTIRQAAVYILSKQAETVWTMGDCDYTDALPFTFNNVTLWDALQTVISALEGAWIEWDCAVWPFKMHIRRRSQTVACEMRESRNIDSMKRDVNDSNFYTRFYPTGNRNIGIAGINGGKDYVERNENLYGVIEHQETDQTKKTPQVLKAWAEAKLAKHAEPIVTVTITGRDFSARTGEPLDKIKIGKMCRVAVPRYGTVIVEPVTQLQWADAVRDPEGVTVTMANTPQDVASIIKQIKSGGGGGASAQAKDAEEDHAWITDTTTYVQMTAEAIAGVGPDGKPNWSRVAQLTVDGNQIDQRVVEAEGDIVTHWSHIQQTELAITQEVAARQALDSNVIKKTERFQSADDILDTATEYTDDEIETVTGSAFWQNRNTIQGVVGEFEVQTDQTTGAKTVVVKSGGGMKIRRDNVEYGLYDNGTLTAGVIVNKINGGTTKISGKNVIIDGDTQINGSAIATALGGQTIGCGSLTVEGQSDIGYAEAYVLHSYTDVSAAGDISAYGGLYTGGRLVNIVDASVNSSTNTLTITKADGTTINFRKAAGDQYDQVKELTLDGTVSSSKKMVAKVTVESSTSGATFDMPDKVVDVSVPYDAGSASVAGGNAYLNTAVITGDYPNKAVKVGASVELTNGRTFNYSWPNTTSYSNAVNTAYADGIASVHPTLIDYWSDGNVRIISNPSPEEELNRKLGQGAYSWNGNTASGNIVVSFNGGTTYYGTGATYSVDATGRYNAGWGAAYGKVSLPTAASTSSSFTIQTPGATVGGTAITTAYAINDPVVDGSDSYIQVKNSSQVVVAQKSVGNVYTTGYNAGKNSVEYGSCSFQQSQITSTSNTLTVTLSNQKTGSIGLSMSGGTSWSGGNCSVFGRVNGNQAMRLVVSMPTTISNKSAYKVNDSLVSCSFSLGGKSYTTTFNI